jgi:hypothetical protein
MSKPQVLSPGNHVAIGTQQLARVTWHEARKGVATIRDGSGAVVVSLPYTGQGNEPSLSFNPPLTVVGGVFASTSSGGWLQIWLQGQSSSGG